MKTSKAAEQSVVFFFVIPRCPTLLHFRWSGCDIGGYTWHGFSAFLWQVSRAKREKERKEEREESGEKKERGKREDERKWKKEKTRGKGGSKE